MYVFGLGKSALLHVLVQGWSSAIQPESFVLVVKTEDSQCRVPNIQYSYYTDRTDDTSVGANADISAHYISAHYISQPFTIRTEICEAPSQIAMRHYHGWVS